MELSIVKIKQTDMALPDLAGWRTRESIDGQQAHLYRKTNDFITCSQSKLFSDSGPVRLHSFNAHQNLLRYFLSAVSLRDESEHLPLSFAEYVQGSRCTAFCRRFVERVPDKDVGQARVHEHPASMYGSYRGKELRVDGPFQYVT